jgi:hypothetical protein
MSIDGSPLDRHIQVSCSDLTAIMLCRAEDALPVQIGPLIALNLVWIALQYVVERKHVRKSSLFFYNFTLIIAWLASLLVPQKISSRQYTHALFSFEANNMLDT